MKTFITVAVFAVVALVFVEINQSSARKPRCPPGKTPPLNTTAVTCDTTGGIGQRLGCVAKCLRCYPQDDLLRRGGCLVNKKCICLAKTKKPPTSPPPTELPTTTDSSSGNETDATTTSPIGGETTTEVANTTPSDPSTPNEGETTVGTTDVPATDAPTSLSP